MNASCAQIGAFVDGELDADEAERFRDHLGGCARCKAELHALVQLRALESEAAARRWAKYSPIK